VRLDGCSSAPAPAPKPVVTVAPPPAAPVATKTPCEQARELRAQVPAFLEQGRLDRTVRTLARADLLCPAEAASTWEEQIAALAEVGRYAEARALCDKIESTKDAPVLAREVCKQARASIATLEKTPADPNAAHANEKKLVAEAQAATAKGDAKTARAKYLSAWEAFHPNGGALFGAALATRTLGDAPGAQRLLDRAVVDYEHVSGEKLELDVPNGFGGFVNGLAFGPQGKLVAVAHRNVVSIVDVGTLRERVRLRGHSQAVTGIAVSPDGKTVATTSRDETARLWDLATGREILRLEGHAGDVTSVAFDHDGAQLATGGRDKTVRIWDSKTGASRGVLVGHSGAVTALAYATTGKRLVSASEDHSAIVWDPSNAKVVAKIAAPSVLRAVSFGSTVALAGEDSTVRLADPSNGEIGKLLAGHSSGVSALSFSPNGKLLASASLDATVKVWDPSSGSMLRSLDGQDLMALAVAWSEGGKRLATGAFNTVHLYDGTSFAEIGRLEGHAAPVTSLAWSPDGHKLAVGANDRTVRLYGGSTAARRLDGHSAPVTALTFSPDGAWLASGSLDGLIRRWDAQTGVGAPPIDGAGAVASLSWSADGKTLAAASPDKSLRLYDPWLSTAKDEASPGPGPGAYGVAFAPDGHRVVFAAIGRIAIVRDTATGKELARLTGHDGAVNAVAWSADGSTIATGSSDRTVRLWDGTTFAAKSTLSTNAPVASVALRSHASSGPAVAAGTTDGAIHLFNLVSPKPLMRLTAHLESVLALSFSADGRFLASGSRDGTTSVFSVPDAQLRASIRGVTSSDAAYAFAPTGELELFGAEARDYPVCRIGPLSVPFELCEERFLEPGLLAKTLR
ncbi:MAG: WD40 domain-containing protein, partial [Polyangiales bacterium]